MRTRGGRENMADNRIQAKSPDTACPRSAKEETMAVNYEITPVAVVRLDLKEALDAFTSLLEEKANDGWTLQLQSYQLLYAQNNYIVSGLVYRMG